MGVERYIETMWSRGPDGRMLWAFTRYPDWHFARHFSEGKYFSNFWEDWTVAWDALEFA